MKRAAALMASLLAACGGGATEPIGNLSGPVALATVPTTRAEGTLVFIANADGQELRVYAPSTRLFLRGPNAISPLSIPIGFRPERLAGAALPGNGPGYVVATGGTRGVAVVDAQTLAPVLLPDPASCGSGDVGTCLRAPGVDVAAFAERTYVLVPPDGGSGTIARYVISQAGDTLAAALEGTTDVPGVPGGLTLSSTGARAFVGDLSTPRLVEVAVPGGGGMRDVAAAAPVRDAVLVPSYANRPADAFLLAILTDGRLQTIDLSAGGPASDPFSPAEPIAPLDFGTPVLDVVFVPCPSDSPNCQTPLQLSTGDTRNENLIAFAALADGTAVPLVPDATHPQVFRPIDTAPGGPSASGVSARTAEGGALTGTSLTVAADSLTEGVTRSEALTVTYQGTIPGLAGRPGSLTESGGTLTLAVTGSDVSDRVRAGDSVVVVASTSEGCPSGRSFVVSSASATGWTLEGTADGCAAPVSLTFDVRAGASEPWVVVSSARGFLGRTSTGATFTIPGERFFYPEGGGAGTAGQFTISGAEPAPGALFQFTTSSGIVPFAICQLTQQLPDSNCQNSSAGGANALAALPGLVYVGLLTGNVLLEATLANLGQSGGLRPLR